MIPKKRKEADTAHEGDAAFPCDLIIPRCIMKHRILALIIAVVMLTACFPTVTVDRPADGSAPGIRVSAGTSAEAAKPKPKKVKITPYGFVRNYLLKAWLFHFTVHVPRKMLRPYYFPL